MRLNWETLDDSDIEWLRDLGRSDDDINGEKLGQFIVEGIQFQEQSTDYDPW